MDRTRKLPEKLQDLMAAIRECIEQGRYMDTRHAFQRQDQRGINRAELLYVLKNGYHEKKKDKFENLYQAWNYAVRGKTLDRRELRVVVSFDEASGMLLITAIELKK